MQSVRQRLLSEHADTVTAVIETGRELSAAIEEWPVLDPDQIRLPLERAVQDSGLSAPLLGMLPTGAAALGGELQGTPVPAPPYLVVTSRGVMCRGTLDDGRRLVVELSIFSVETRPRRYQFCDPTASECLELSIR